MGGERFPVDQPHQEGRGVEHGDFQPQRDRDRQTQRPHRPLPVAVALYLIGFAEAVVGQAGAGAVLLVEGWDLRIVSLLTLAVLLGVCFVGLRWVVRFPLALLAVLVLSPCCLPKRDKAARDLCRAEGWGAYAYWCRCVFDGLAVPAERKAMLVDEHVLSDKSTVIWAVKPRAHG